MKDFKCYQISLDGARGVRPLIRRIEACDVDLARQLRRCLSSVPLNIAEGSRSRGKNVQARYSTAMGSAREVIACLEVAEALGYLNEADLPTVVDRFDHVIAILFKLCR